MALLESLLMVSLQVAIALLFPYSLLRESLLMVSLQVAMALLFPYSLLRESLLMVSLQVAMALLESLFNGFSLQVAIALLFPYSFDGLGFQLLEPIMVRPCTRNKFT